MLHDFFKTFSYYPNTFGLFLKLDFEVSILQLVQATIKFPFSMGKQVWRVAEITQVDWLYTI